MKRKLFVGESGWIPKLWTSSVRKAAVNVTNLPLAGGSRAWARVPENKKAGAKSHPGREDSVDNWLFICDVPAVGSAAVAPQEGAG